MELTDLGFDAWFQEKHEELKRPELRVARITRVDRDRYLVRNEKDEVQAEATGNFLYSVESPQSLPCIGDWVLVQYYNDGELALIHHVLPRKTFLRRKAAGYKIDYQMIGANIDVAFIMQSCDEDFNIRRMERYLVIVRDGHIEPVILLSKSDLVDAETLKDYLSEIRNAHIEDRVIAVSNTTGDGLQAFGGELKRGKTYCLLGSSGVGKTTLLNHLFGREEFDTQPVREKDSRGRHTTARRQLSVLESGVLVIDTPGMRELGMMDVNGSINESFSEIRELSGACRFKDCTHTVETGCAVLRAVEDGSLDDERYRSYLKLLKESRFYQMSYAERRKKDKQFGRMVNTELKQLRKRKPSV